MRQFPPEFFKKIPNTPGVYFMLGSRGEILYIGKAKRLRRRISSYRQVKAETHPPHQVELMKKVRELRWETHRTEKLALAREFELLHAIRPPYNIADTEEGSYVFITLRPKGMKAGKTLIEFQLTSEPDGEPDGDREVQVFGCYKDRWQAKRGFGALLRLMHSATFESTKRTTRFSIPSTLRTPRMDLAYVLALETMWISALGKFFRGSSLELLRLLTSALIENENVPRFMGPSLQDDIDCAREFFRRGPKSTRLLKRRNARRARVLSHQEMDELIRLSVRI